MAHTLVGFAGRELTQALSSSANISVSRILMAGSIATILKGDQKGRLKGAGGIKK
jgi:hypothetical protein